MSVTGCNSIGIPVILLHDAEGGHVTVELKNGFSYRGILDEAQDNFNCTLKHCTRVDPKGEETELEMTLIRGGQIRYIVVPEMLMHAPYFDRIKAWRKYKGNPIVGGTGDQAKAYERARKKSHQQMGVGDKRGRHGGGPPPGQMGGMGMPPRGMMPQGIPQGMSPGMPLQGMPMMPPPHMMPGMPPPQGVMPPKGIMPGVPPQGIPRGPNPYGPPMGGPPPGQGYPGPYGAPRGPPPS